MKAAILVEHAEVEVEGSPRRYPHLPLKKNPLLITNTETPTPRRGAGSSRG
jgi:hypothetical protein